MKFKQTLLETKTVMNDLEIATEAIETTSVKELKASVIGAKRNLK